MVFYKMKNFPGYIVAEKDSESRKIILDSIRNESSGYLTICEQIRFIYDTVYQLPDGEIKEDLTEKLIDAFNMGKKMNSRLQRYKRETNSQTGSAGSNLMRLDHVEERQKLRRERE